MYFTSGTTESEKGSLCDKIKRNKSDFITAHVIYKENECLFFILNRLFHFIGHDALFFHKLFIGKTLFE